MTNSKEKDKKPDKPHENEPKVSYFQIFRYGSCLEKTATILGVILGFLSGAGVTFNLVQLGELSTAFVERTNPPTDRYTTYLPILSTFGGGRRIFNATHEESMAALLEDAKALAIGTFVSVGISMLFTALSVALINWSALRQITTIRMSFLKAVLRQDMTWFDTDIEFNLASKMTENLAKLRDGMGEKLAVVTNLLGTAILSMCIAIPLGWKLALACATVMPFSIAATVALSNYQTKSSAREMESYSQAGKHAEEIMKSVRTVVAFGGEGKEVDRYSDLLQPAERYGCRRGLFNGLGNGFNWVLTYCLNAIGLSYGARLVLEDMYKPDGERIYVVGIVFSVLFSVYMATQSVTLCVPHIEVFASARGAAASIFHLLERRPVIDSFDNKGVSPRRVMGEISLENVHFSYPSRPDIQVLDNFSIQIKTGECVALVGSSGCGKSTILQLLQRLYDPQSGSVKIDGKDLRNLNLRWLRSSLGVVGQEPVLFQGTIFENISIACPEATLEEVQRVASMAYAHEFITNLPKGYDTVIGERGASLSGGQKQRIAIARSLLLEPAVLLLDEATSALDPHSERQVQAALDRASVGRTTIMVSHRLATIVNAGRIICMDKGIIVEQGTHEELMKSKGFYYKLVTTDNKGKEIETLNEEIPPLPEKIEEEHDSTDTENVDNKPRTEEILNEIKHHIQKQEQRRRLQKHSSLIENQDRMTPRGSLTSVMSVGYTSFMLNDGIDNKEDEEEIEEVSGWQILKLNAPEWVYITIGSIAAFTQGGCFPAFALLFGYTIGIFALADHELMLRLADLYSGLFLVVATIAGVCMCLQSAMFTTAGLKMTTRLRIQYFTALLRQEIGYYDRQSNTVGALCARLSGDTAEVQGGTGLRIGIILQGVSSVVLGVVMGFVYDWKLTLVSSAFLPIMVGSIWLEGRMSQQAETDERDAMEAATSVATEAVVSIRTVQSLGVETVFMDKFQKSVRAGCKAVETKARWRGVILGMGIYVPFISFCSANAYGTTLVADGTMEYKVVLLVTEAVMFGAYMLGQTLVYATSLNTAKTCAGRILSVINRQPEIKTEDGVKDKKDWTATGSFSIKEVEFSYPTRKRQKILRGIDLNIEAGKTVALVGSSGCGKSTVLQLMQRFYDPDTGSIFRDYWAQLSLLLDYQVCRYKHMPLVYQCAHEKHAYLTCEQQEYIIRMKEFEGEKRLRLMELRLKDTKKCELDGVNSRTALTLPRLRQQLGVVQQEPVLFDRTLAENIAYGANNRKVDMNEIIAAAKAANIHSFVTSLPKGYDTSLGASGAQLSGGQKQRVCIARALMRSPRLLLLDEATSALDANSERAVSEALDKAAEGRTCITIAHRLSTIQNADLICVLDRGKIVERGNHQELIRMRGYYYKMCKGQNMVS